MNGLVVSGVDALCCSCYSLEHAPIGKLCFWQLVIDGPKIIILLCGFSPKLNCGLEIEMRYLHDKTNKITVCPAKTQISLGLCPVWSEFSLSAWRNHGSLAPIERTVKTLIRLGGCPGWSESSLGAQIILSVLSWGGSYKKYLIVSELLWKDAHEAAVLCWQQVVVI